MEILRPRHPRRVIRLKQYIARLSGLVGYWPMWEGDGLVANNHAPDNLRSLNGTISGGVVLGQAGPVGRAYDFDGDDDYVDCGRNSALNAGSSDFTIIFWLNGASTGTNERLVSKGADGTGGKRYITTVNTSDQLLFQVDDDINNRTITGTTDVIDGNWHMAAAKRDGTNIHLFVDGASDQTAVAIGAEGSLDDANKDFVIGVSSNDEMSFNFDGKIAHVAFIARALTTAEILKMAKISGVA